MNNTESARNEGNISTPLSGLDADDVSVIEKVIEGSLLSVVCVVSLTGNTCLWFVIFGRRSLWNAANWLILCLSAADLLVSVVNMPITIITIAMGRWIFNDVTCVATGFTNMVTFIASVMSLGTISINRYVKVCRSSSYNTVYKPRNVAIMGIGVWLMSVLLATPPLVGWGVYAFLPNQSFCFCDWSSSVSYTFFMVSTCFGGPCTAMTVSYVLILRTYRRSKQKILLSVKDKRRELPNLSRSSVRENKSDSCACYSGSTVLPHSDIPNEVTMRDKTHTRSSLRKEVSKSLPVSSEPHRDEIWFVSRLRSSLRILSKRVPSTMLEETPEEEEKSVNSVKTTSGVTIEVSGCDSPDAECQAAVVMRNTSNHHHERVVGYLNEWYRDPSAMSERANVPVAGISFRYTNEIVSKSTEVPSVLDRVDRGGNLAREQSDPRETFTGNDMELVDVSLSSVLGHSRGDDEEVHSASNRGFMETDVSTPRGIQAEELELSSLDDRGTEEERRTKSLHRDDSGVSKSSIEEREEKRHAPTFDKESPRAKRNTVNIPITGQAHAATTVAHAHRAKSSSLGFRMSRVWSEATPAVAATRGHRVGSGTEQSLACFPLRIVSNDPQARRSPNPTIQVRPIRPQTLDREREGIDAADTDSCRTSSSLSPSDARTNLIKRPMWRPEDSSDGASTYASKLESIEMDSDGKILTSLEKRRRREDRRLTFTLLIIILVFVVAWLPFCVTMFLSVFMEAPVPRVPDFMSLFLGFANSACNPIIYGFANAQFREGYRRIFRKFLSPFKTCAKRDDHNMASEIQSRDR